MTGKVNFRNDGNTKVGGISYDILDLLLCVESAVTSSVTDEGIEVLVYNGLVTERTDLSQTGIFLDLDSPSLIFGKMPVKTVEFMHRHDIKILLDFIYVKEMAAGIHMHTPVGESGLVLDIRFGKHPFLRRCALSGKICFGKHL